MQYLKKAMQLELVYGQKLDGADPRDLSLYDFIGYADNNLVGDSKDRKSVMGHYFILNRVVVL